MKKSGMLFLILFTLVLCRQTEKESVNTNHSSPNYYDTLSSHFLHELEFEPFESLSEEHWDSINHTIILPPNKRKTQRSNNYKTFGWHLYSTGSAYKNYDFSQLWGVSYFAYIINPENGLYKNIHQWKTTGLVDSANINGCKVFLTLANFGEKNNNTFLSKPIAQQTLTDTVGQLLLLRNADGINIDFEGIHPENKRQFSNFVKTISKKLKGINPEFQISLCLYAVDYHEIFEITEIDSFIDFYTLMGYDYYGSFSSFAGPVAPLNSSKTFGPNSLQSSVNYYLKKDVKPEKLIVGLPHYGADWIVQDSAVIAKTEKFHSHKSYKTIKSEILNVDTIAIQFDSTSATNYCNFQINGKIRQLWFDDVETLSLKYDWIKQEKLAGVAVWALGFDNGSTELWNLLSEKFGETSFNNE